MNAPKPQNKRRTFTRREAIIIAVIGAGVLATSFFVTRRPNLGYAVIHDSDGNTTTAALDGSDGTTFTIKTSYGTNVVVISDGSVHVSEADCKGHDCMKQGSINSVGQQIVCLPHKLWIEIVDKKPSDNSSDTASSNSSSSTSGDYDTVTR